jgi:hypothetical protein
MYYDFGRVHQTLRVTPAMEAGVASHVWSVEEIVGLLDDFLWADVQDVSGGNWRRASVFLEGFSSLDHSPG